MTRGAPLPPPRHRRRGDGRLAVREEGAGPSFSTVRLAAVTPTADGARLVVSRAGRPLPLLVRSDADVTAVGRSGSLLGVLTDLQLSEQPFEAAQGDALALTDGIAERRRGRVGDDMAVSAICVPRGATPAAHPHAAGPTVTTMAAG